MTEKMKVLFVGAHPHDVLAQAGGTLALHAQRGDSVTAAVLTHGGTAHTFKYMDEIEQGSKGLSEDQLNDEGLRLQREIRDAAAVLGITDMRFIHTVDDIVVEERPLIRLVEDVIRDVKPEIIVTHHPMAESGVGFVHATTGKIVMHAFKSARALRPESGMPPHWVSQIFFITPPQITNSLDDAIPRSAAVFIDVTRVIHLKVEAERKVTSQYREETALKTHECQEGYWGGLQTKIAPYCEVFTPYFPEISDHLPLGRYLRERWETVEQRVKSKKSMSTMIVPDL